MSHMFGAAIALSFLVAACGDPGGSGGTIDLDGTIYSNHRVDMACDALDGDGAIRAGMSGVIVEITDPDGTVLDTVETGDFTWVALEHGCRYSVTFTARVAESDAYVFRFQPNDPPARGPYYDGIGELGTIERSHSAAAAAGFAVRFEAPPTFVVP